MASDLHPASGITESPAHGTGRPSDPGPVTRHLLTLVQAAGEQPPRLAAEYATHLRDLGTAEAVATDLRAMAQLAAERHPAGIALARALLATAPAGHRLLATVRWFRSTRRLRDGAAGAPPAAWRERCDRLGGGTTGADLALALRGRCDALLAHVVRGAALADADRAELADLLSLEADARDERVRDLAARLVDRGIDEARQRLEQVAALDVQLQDLRDLVAHLAADGGRQDVVAPHNRFVRALGESGRDLVQRALDGAADLERLALLWRGLAAPVPALPDPESAWLRLMALARSPAAATLLPADPDPLGLAVLVVARGEGGRVRLPLAPEARDVLAGGDAPVLPEGVAVEGDDLVIACDDAFRTRIPRPRPAAVEEEETVDEGASALKRLVLTNLQSTSVTIAFLRDPKVYAIPGLVEEVVNRVRNPQIIEMVANTRTLHGGFANRGVPLALLKSPVNVPPKVLRKFIHVKYISKVELKRLANDRTGIRREVGKAIEHYLASLA